MNKNLRLTNSIDELKTYLGQIKSNNVNFMTWQNINNEKSVINTVLSNFVQNEEKFFIDFNIADAKKIIRDEKVFFFCPDFNILIKGKVKKLSKDKMRILVNKKFYLNEARELYRMDVQEKNISLFIKRKIELQNKDKDETVQLKDLCNGGCGFLVTSGRAMQFQKGNSIKIEKLGKITLDEPISGLVAHVTAVKASHDLNENLFHIGIKFDEIVPNIDHLLQMCEFGMTKILT